MAWGVHAAAAAAVGLLWLRVASLAAQPVPSEKIAVGAIFDQDTEEIQSVFRYALTAHNQEGGRRPELQAYVDVINTADAFKLSRLICNQFARGVFAMLGAVAPDSFDTLHSYTNTFQMPFVTPWFPEKVTPPSSGLVDHAVSMRPDYHGAIVDTVLHYGWKELIYMYDSHDGLLRLQQLYGALQPGRAAFRVALVRRVADAAEAVQFLEGVERHDRWGAKRVVLDCGARLAKAVLLQHVRSVRLGRRTYHYLLSGLVMDEHWENEVTEYGAVNVTGFRIVDPERKVVRDFTEGLRRAEPRFKGTVAAEAALMYDGVQVLTDALGRLWRKKPDAFRGALRRAAAQANATKVIDCDPGKGWVVPFEHGDKISRLIKKSEIEGLTGNVAFDERGHRRNFSLHVVEMTVRSATVQIGTWTDAHGLRLLEPKYVPLKSPASVDANRTYVVLSPLREPCLMRSPAANGREEGRYYGLCKDFVALVANKLGIKYELRAVREERRGGGAADDLSALLGALGGKDADFGIGALGATAEREWPVDFGEPFLTVAKPVKPANALPKQLADAFGFLRPLSKEIWLCVVFSFFAVSVVLFLVSRFSPHEWRSVSTSDAHLDHPMSGADEIILHNEFSIWNSFWFSLGSFMQQGSDVVPRSLSGRIVGTAWWFFALVLVCSYTANLAAYLIVERLSEPHAQGTDRDGGCVGAGSRSRRYSYTDFAIATPKGSALRESIDLAIVGLKEEGVTSKLWRKWALGAEGPDDEETAMTELTLSQVAGVFYVLLGGLALALAVALADFCQHGRAEAARAHVPLRAALRARAQLASATAARERKAPPRRSARGDRDTLAWNGAAFAGYFAGAQLPQEDAAHAGFAHV